ncbi:hypothetical protein AAVH_23050 [Aphelenchoides avenae]|nr:hypothetical protein AAVH_23050 [Aphelenchus avenae]
MATATLTLDSGPFFEGIREEVLRQLSAIEEIKAVCDPINENRFRELKEELASTTATATNGQAHGDGTGNLTALTELEQVRLEEAFHFSNTEIQMWGVDADQAEMTTADVETQTEPDANASTRPGSSGSATSVSSAASRSQAASGPKESLKKGAADKPWNRPLKLMPCAARKPAPAAAAGPSKPGGLPKGPRAPTKGAPGPSKGATGPSKGAPGPAKGATGPTKGAPGSAKGPPGPPKGPAGPPRSGQPAKRNPFAKYDAVIMM